jgi:hypothetical protein
MGIYSSIANWKGTLNKLGVAKKRSKGVKRPDFRSRGLRIESLESREMLAVIYVTELADENDHSIGNYEQFAADGNDDGDVDPACYSIWSGHYGNSFELYGVNIAV